MKTDYERLETRRFRELRKENIRLRRENKELRKQLRLNEIAASEADAEQEAFEYVPLDYNGKPEYTCPECHQPAIPFDLAGRPYYRCPSCSSKGKITA